MSKVSQLFSFSDVFEMTEMGYRYSDISNNPAFYFMSRGEFLIVLMRYLLVLPLLLILMDVLWPDLFDELVIVALQSWPAVFSLVLLIPCYYRLKSQGLSHYLLLINLFPLINYLPLNILTLPLCGAFLLYLIFINIYPGERHRCERKIEINHEIPGGYPLKPTIGYFFALNLLGFLFFELDDAAILLIMISWISFLLTKFHWPVVIINIIGAIGIFIFLSSDFSDLKHHQNIFIDALIKISLLDSVLFLMFSLSLFLNMLFWLEERDRNKTAPEA